MCWWECNTASCCVDIPWVVSYKMCERRNKSERQLSLSKDVDYPCIRYSKLISYSTQTNKSEIERRRKTDSAGTAI